jgi:hypothetical protein
MRSEIEVTRYDICGLPGDAIQHTIRWSITVKLSGILLASQVQASGPAAGGAQVAGVCAGCARRRSKPQAR